MINKFLMFHNIFKLQKKIHPTNKIHPIFQYKKQEIKDNKTRIVSKYVLLTCWKCFAYFITGKDLIISNLKGIVET